MHSKPRKIKIATRQIVATPKASVTNLFRGITQSTDCMHALCQHGYKRSSGNECASFPGLMMITVVSNIKFKRYQLASSPKAITWQLASVFQHMQQSHINKQINQIQNGSSPQITLTILRFWICR